MEDLIKIQNELKAPKTQRNKFGNYDYRSCDDIFQAVKPLLQKYNCTLTVSDGFIPGDIPVIEAKATITDLEGHTQTVTAYAGIDINQKGMAIPQTFGSASSYARKYALNGLFLIDDTKDDDATNTHGNEQINKTQVQKPAQKAPIANAPVALKNELILLLNNELITEKEKAAYLPKIGTFTPAQIEDKIKGIKKVIADRLSKA